MEKSGFVYILTNEPYGSLYIGVTSDLTKRIHEHKSVDIAGFTKKYHTHDLVYFEEHTSIEEAIKREKRLKHWKRDWKIQLIEKDNPEWKDLYESIL